MNLSFTHLLYFKMAAEKKNLSRAAEQLYITQPALSKSIAAIEDEFDCILFIRNGRSLELTEPGKRFYNWANEVLRSYNEMQTQIQEWKMEDSDTLSVAISGVYYSKKILFGFREKHPEINLKETSFYKDDFPDIVYKNDIDCILSSINIEGNNVKSFEVFREPLVVVVNKSHPLADRESIRLEEMAEYPITFANANHLYLDTVKSIYKQAGIPLKIRSYLVREHAIDSVNKGAGVMLVAMSSTYAFDAETTRIIRLEDPFCFRSIYLIWDTTRGKNTKLDLFVQYIKETYIA